MRAWPTRLNVLLCWESIETNSWNPVLADLLRDAGLAVTEAHDLDALRSLDLSDFDVCLPRFRVGAAHMTCLDEALVASGIPMLNSRDCAAAMREQGARAPRVRGARDQRSRRSFVWSADGVRDRRVEWQGETLLKPLYGNRGSGIEICDSLPEALERAAGRREDLLRPADDLAGALLADRRRADRRRHRSLLAPAAAVRATAC